MTCKQFSRDLDLRLSDPRRGATLTATARRHVAQCLQCRRLWTRAEQFIRMCDAVAGDALPATAVRSARQRFEQALERTSQPAVRFDWLQTPVGRVFVGVSARGVCDVTVDETSADRYRARLDIWATDVQRDPRAVAPAIAEINSYFAGHRTRFSLTVDLRLASPFTARVLRAIRQIPFGRVASYGDIAARIGAPRASRAVGCALGRNPVPIIVPCHRVIAGTRRLGGYSGGLAVKRALLELEGHMVAGGATGRRSAVAPGSRVVDRAARPGQRPL